MKNKLKIVLISIIAVVLGVGVYLAISYRAETQARTQHLEEFYSKSASFSNSLDTYERVFQPLYEYCDEGWGDSDSCTELSLAVKENREILEGLDDNFLDLTQIEESTADFFGHVKAEHQRFNQIHRQVVTSLEEESQEKWDEGSSKLEETVSKGKDLLESTKEKVNDNQTRKDLNEEIVSAEDLLDLNVNTYSLKIRHYDELASHEKALIESMAKVQESHDAWNKQKEEEAQAARIAAEQAAQAAQTVNSYNTSSSSGTTTQLSGGGSSTPTHYISASQCSDPWQAQSCVDGYSITATDFSPWGGPYWIGGHSGGSAGQFLSWNVGDKVEVSGAGAGTYQITSVSWVPKVAGQQASSLGAGFAFQTCSGNQMKVLYATRV